MATHHAGLAASRFHQWAHDHPAAFRRVLNLYPCYFGTGGRVAFIAPDWSGMRVELRLSRRTKNYVGTIFGGSLYACVDPMFMFMLMHQLGPDYLVWDKGASIRFRRPGTSTLVADCRLPPTSTLVADCRLPPGEAQEVKRLLESAEKVDRTYRVDLVGSGGAVHASIEKIVNVRRAGGARPAPN